MAFTSDIPKATDRISDSQAPIKDNFGSIDTVVSINHVPFDDASGDQGKHKHVSLPVQGAAPGTAATEVALYSKESAYTVGKTVLSYQHLNNGTSYDIGDGGSAAGWSFLPSGVLMKWGYFSWTTAEAQDVLKVIPSASSPPFTGISCVSYQVNEASGVEIDAAVRQQAFVALSQSLDVYITKRTSSAKPTSNFTVYYLVFGTP